MEINLNLHTILKFGKYLLIPILLLLYINFLDVLLATASTLPAEQGQGGGAGGIQVIGIGFTATVSVTRQYLFGLVRLPVYVGDLGDISGIHNIFFAILGLMTVGFLVWDLHFLVTGKTSYTYGSKYQWRR